MSANEIVVGLSFMQKYRLSVAHTVENCRCLKSDGAGEIMRLSKTVHLIPTALDIVMHFLLQSQEDN